MILFLTKKFIQEKWLRNLFLPSLAVSLGVVSLLITFSLLMSFQSHLEKITRGLMPHILIKKKNEDLKNSELIDIVKGVRGVEECIQAQHSIRILEYQKNNCINSVKLRTQLLAFQPGKSTQFLDFSILSPQSELNNLANNSIMLSPAIYKSISRNKFSKDFPINIRIADKQNNQDDNLFWEDDVSFFDQETESKNPSNWSLLSIQELTTNQNIASHFKNLLIATPETLNKILDKIEPDAIWVRIKNRDNAVKISDEIIDKLHGKSCTVSNWISFSEKAYNRILAWKFVSLLVGILLIIIASSCVISIISLIIREKRKQIALLKSIGASSFKIKLIFLLIGLIIGIAGNLIANIIVNTLFLFFDLSIIIHFFFPSAIIHFDISYSDQFIIIGTSILICIASAYLPARSASRIDPVKGLKG